MREPLTAEAMAREYHSNPMFYALVHTMCRCLQQGFDEALLRKAVDLAVVKENQNETDSV